MSTGRENFAPCIQLSKSGVKNDVVCLSGAQLAYTMNRGVSLASVHQLPSDICIYINVYTSGFQFMYKIAESFKPYNKPGNIPMYVHKLSNHPPAIIKNIPKNINQRLSSISSDEKMFQSVVPLFQEALEKKVVVSCCQ